MVTEMWLKMAVMEAGDRRRNVWEDEEGEGL